MRLYALAEEKGGQTGGEARLVWVASASCGRLDRLWLGVFEEVYGTLDAGHACSKAGRGKGKGSGGVVEW